jgi:hypothetical protein
MPAKGFQVGEEARGVVVDFLDSWRFCPVSEAATSSRSCLEDAATQLLEAAAPLIYEQAADDVRAELLSGEVLTSVARHRWPLWIAMKQDQKEQAMASVRETIESAFASLDAPIRGDGEDGR